jgi:hypothetical protein
MEKGYVKIENTFCCWKTHFTENRCMNKKHPKLIGWIFPKCGFEYCPPIKYDEGKGKQTVKDLKEGK